MTNLLFIISRFVKYDIIMNVALKNKNIYILMNNFMINNVRVIYNERVSLARATQVVGLAFFKLRALALGIRESFLIIES